MATQINGQDQGGSGHTIQNETTPLTARANMNFTGAGVTAADNAGAGTTDVTIAGGGGAGITDITYADLVTAIGGSTLTPGGLYQMEFRTTHYIVDGDGTRYFTKIAQVDTVTLTGTSGTASITDAGGLTKTVTFNSDLTTTASDFVTSFAADYLAQGIVLTSSTVDLIFTANVAGTAFVHPAIANVTGDLTGTSIITTMNDDPIIIGTLEHLIFMATSANTISREVYSKEYPQDIIHYDWNPNNWLKDLSFADAEVTALIIIDGFKGVITFRHDTLLDNYAGFDWRNCKSRRWKINVPIWVVTVEYHAGDYITYINNKIYRGIATGTGQVPTESSSAYWVEQLDLNLSEYWNIDPTGSFFIPSGNIFFDFKLFAEGLNTALYEKCCRNNHFGGYKDNYSDYMFIATILSNDVFHLQDLNIVSVYSNSIERSGYDTIGGIFCLNVVSRFNANKIGDNFNINTIGDFVNNLIGKQFNSNVIGANFNNNVIGNYFDGNTISGMFISNTIGYYFYQNFVENTFDSVDFSSATHVYATYNCTLFTDSLGNKKLSYIDGTTGLLVVVNANA